MFDFLFGRDPTRDWRRNTDQFTFALDEARLNAARLGDPADAVSFLGPAEDRGEARQGTFCYYSLGLMLSAKNDAGIEWFEIIYRDELQDFQPYRGRVTFRGEPIDLAGMSPEAFLARCGDCYWRDRTDDETILFYEFPGREWQVEFDVNGLFERVLVTTDMIMADPEQRAAYGVTKPWPPVEWDG